MRYLRERIARFMAGRYGVDSLYYALFVSSFVLFIINMFLINFRILSLIIALVADALFFYAIFRFLSRNVYKRQKENTAYLNFMKKPKQYLNLIKCKFRDRKTHVYKRCPSCRNNLRLPKEKGKHTVVCPCCKNRFDVRI